jgi:hypothetical protein
MNQVKFYLTFSTHGEAPNGETYQNVPISTLTGIRFICWDLLFPQKPTHRQMGKDNIGSYRFLLIL